MSIQIITSGDLDNKLVIIDNQKLTVQISAETGNQLVQENDGLFVEIPASAVQQQSDWNETDIGSVSFIKNKPTIPTDTGDLTNNAGFITAAQVPADKFLNNASYDSGTQILTLTLSDSSTVTVNLQDLIPVTVKVAGGLKGVGTSANPLELDKTDARTVLGYGTMADETAADYHKTSTLTVELKDLAGNTIGFIHPTGAES